MAMLELRNLTRRFDDFVAVDDVSLGIEAGEFFTLLGARRHLDWIEHEQLRPNYADPRVHFVNDDARALAQRILGETDAAQIVGNPDASDLCANVCCECDYGLPPPGCCGTLADAGVTPDAAPGPDAGAR